MMTDDETDARALRNEVTRHALELERADATARLADLTREIAAIIDASTSVAVDDEHDPDGATIAFEREQLSALRDQARRHLVSIEDAFERLLQGTYGRCENCGTQISTERLTARPATSTCIACAT
jgi:RNA polymerase-binding protein DksA